MYSPFILSRMKPLPGLIVSLAIPVLFFQPAKGQAPAAGSILDRFPELMKQTDEEMAKKFEAVRAVVEDEVKEKRLSEAIAQSLRWTLRTASSGAIGEVRMVISNARVPVENAAITKAFRELETTNAGVQARKNELMTEVRKELRQRIAATVGTATTPAEVEAMRATSERLRDALREAGKTGYAETQELDHSLNILASTKRLLEAEVAGEERRMGVALSELSSYARSNSAGVPTSEIQARIDRVVQPFVKSAGEKRAALDTALEAQKSPEEIEAALNAYSEAMDRLGPLPQIANAGDAGRGEYLRLYKALATALKDVQSGDGEKLQSAISDARRSLQQMEGKPAIRLVAVLDQWTKEATERAAKERLEHATDLKTRLAAAKKPADLAPILMDLETWSEKSGDRRTGAWSENQEIFARLSILATAWSSGSLALLQWNRGGESVVEKSVIAKEYGELRKRVEREVMSRALGAPELNEGEALALPLETAVEKLCDALFAGADWRRLYRVLDARSRFQVPGEYNRQPDETVTTLRAFFAGQNLELAEQWAEAAQSYRAVLRCVSDRAPIKPAAERLKILAKEHPESGAKAGAPAR